MNAVEPGSTALYRIYTGKKNVKSDGTEKCNIADSVVKLLDKAVVLILGAQGDCILNIKCVEIRVNKEQIGVCFVWE